LPKAPCAACRGWALLLFCLAYVVPGFVGREPWKNADMTAFGYMLELARRKPPG
jgi:hypothetical protein